MSANDRVTARVTLGEVQQADANAARLRRGAEAEGVQMPVEINLPPGAIDPLALPAVQEEMRAWKLALAYCRAAGWRPIAEAPRDGTPILGGHPRFARPAVFEWDDEYRNWWTNDSEANGSPQPSHWQPLPDPPPSAGEGGDG